MDINYVKNKIYNGMPFNKVKCESKIIKVMDNGFTYSIGKNGNKKKVVFTEVEEAIVEIDKTGSINRKWYKDAFPKKAQTSSCNFTSIGGVLEKLGYVKYIDNNYIKIEK